MRILTISTGKVDKLFIAADGPGRTVKSALNKSPVSQLTDPVPVFAGPLGLERDEQADLTVHGGPDKAIYAYPVEHYDFWEKTLEQNDCGLGTLAHGFFGENLTIEGFSEDEVFVGDLWQIGEVELMVENLREPCFKFTGKIGYPDAAPVMVRTARSGWYLSVLQPGTLKAGDLIQVIPGDREVSIAMQNALLKIKRKL